MSWPRRKRGSFAEVAALVQDATRLTGVLHVFEATYSIDGCCERLGPTPLWQSRVLATIPVKEPLATIPVKESRA